MKFKNYSLKTLILNFVSLTVSSPLILNEIQIAPFQFLGFLSNVARKNIWSSQKFTLEYDLSCIIRKDNIYFSKNMTSFFRQKRTDHLSQNNTWKYLIFCKCSEKLVCLKRCTGIWSFLYCQENWYLKIWSYSLEKRRKIIFLQKMHGNMIVFVYLENMVFC